MTTTRTAGRARRVVLAAAGLGVAALAVAPAASATGTAYPPSGPSQGSQVLDVKHGSTTTHSSTAVLGTKHSSDTLAFTGAEVGGVAATGLALVVGGALLVRGGRRRGSSAA